MPNLKWSELTPMQLGQYAEYYSKMEFTSYGYDVYTSEVDDHGVDFVAKDSKSDIFYEVQVKPMSEIMKDIMMSDGMPEEIADMMVQETPVDKSMYVVTNADKIGGAATIVYSDALEKLSEQLGTDLIILPSSVHEVIALSAEGLAPEEMANMVVEVNENELLPEDKLSDHVYRYDAQAHTLKLADTTLEELEKENGRSIEQGEDLAVKPKRAR